MDDPTKALHELYETISLAVGSDGPKALPPGFPPVFVDGTEKDMRLRYAAVIVALQNYESRTGRPLTPITIKHN